MTPSSASLPAFTILKRTLATAVCATFVFASGATAAGTTGRTDSSKETPLLLAQALTPGSSAQDPAATPPPPTASPADMINLGITPLRAELTLGAGASTSQPIRITNTSKDNIQMRGAVVDWTLSPAGDLVYRKRSETASWGCGKWLQINPVEFTMGPGQTQLVRYTLAVPREAGSGGYHCAIAFDMQQPTRARVESAMGVINLVRLLTAIYVTIGTPEIQAKVKSIELVRSKDGKTWNIVTEFENPGTTQYRVGGSVELLGEDGRLIRKFDYANFPVLPGVPRADRLEFADPLPPGSYRLRAVIDVGAKERLGADVRVTVAR
jgi:fimbrial chaperone protein